MVVEVDGTNLNYIDHVEWTSLDNGERLWVVSCAGADMPFSLEYGDAVDPVEQLFPEKGSVARELKKGERMEVAIGYQYDTLIPPAASTNVRTFNFVYDGRALVADR
jgi:hypothetical protein